MRVLRRAAVLVLLGLSLETTGVYAVQLMGPPRSMKTASPGTLHFLDTLWRNVTGIRIKAGCTINPWGQCVASSTSPPPNTDAVCTINPLGGCSPGH
jgi:hypothetical protein